MLSITEQENAVLTVTPFDNQLQSSKQLHPDLPQPPFTTLLVGPKGSGKSNVILRMLWGNKKPRDCKKGDTKYRFYRHFFDKIYVFSPTWSIDPKMQRCRIPDDQIFEEPDEYDDVLTEIVNGQEEDIREDGKDSAEHVLLIFSDLAGTKLFKNNRGILNRIAFNHRHFKISSILDSQSLRQINSAFRNNLSGVMLFAGISNRLEVNKIIEEYLGRFSQKEARQILKHAFKNPFDFLYVNLQNRGSLYRNFNLLNIQSQEQDD